MHRLRRARHLAVAMLAWFVLSLGAALLAPAFAQAVLPQDICSAEAGATLAGGDDEGVAAVLSHVAHCPACVHGAAPPPAAVVAAVHLHAPAARPQARAQAPLPEAPRAPWTARGPPSFS